MSERLNKTSICCVVFLDIIEYTQMPVSEQIACKDRFNCLINDAIKDVAQNDRILVDSGDGAAITLLGAPEEALFIALTIRDEIYRCNQEPSAVLLNVRIGINLGPVRVVKDINDRLNIIGDGINVAQRVMSFAEVNQILVSRSYYEIVSRLSSEIPQMFVYSGIKHDKHVREHEVYVIRPPQEAAASNDMDAMEEALVPAQTRQRDSFMSKALVAAGLALAVFGIGVMMSAGNTQPTVGTTKTALSSAAETARLPAASDKIQLANKSKAAHKLNKSLTRKQDKEFAACPDAQRSLHQCG